MNSLKELKGVSHDNRNNKVSKKTKGQLFKERHGISVTMHKNIKKALGIPRNEPVSQTHISEYKASRKTRKKAQKREWQKKREASGLYMMTNGSGKRKTKHKGRAKKGSATNRYIAPKI